MDSGPGPLSSAFYPPKRPVRIWRNLDDNFWGVTRSYGYAMVTKGLYPLTANQAGLNLPSSMNQGLQQNALNQQAQQAQQHNMHAQQSSPTLTQYSGTLNNNIGQIQQYAWSTLGWTPPTPPGGRKRVTLEFKDLTPYRMETSILLGYDLRQSVDDTAYDVIAPLNGFLKKRNQ